MGEDSRRITKNDNVTIVILGYPASSARHPKDDDYESSLTHLHSTTQKSGRQMYSMNLENSHLVNLSKLEEEIRNFGQILYDIPNSIYLMT
jgi:hypothetical protein